MCYAWGRRAGGATPSPFSATCWWYEFSWGRASSSHIMVPLPCREVTTALCAVCAVCATSSCRSPWEVLGAPTPLFRGVRRQRAMATLAPLAARVLISTVIV